MTRLLFVRHGETQQNSSERYWGKTDVLLGKKGLRQAEQLRQRLSLEKIDHIYSSDMKRAMVTAQIIASAHNLDVYPCPGLREIDFGKVEGLNFKEVGLLFPEVTRLWLERNTKLVYPDGESIAALEERVATFRRELARHDQQETVLIVAHSGVLRTLICQIMDWDMEKRWQIRIDLAALSIVYTYPEGAILTLLNDVCHLKEDEE